MIPRRNTKRDIHMTDGQYPSDVQHIRDMPLIMKLRFRFVMLMLACCVLAGCKTQPVAREALVGSYTYVSNDPESRATDHAWDRLTLQADGKYQLVQGGPTEGKTEKTGVWHFSGGDPHRSCWTTRAILSG
jgi:hypothetical protein